MASSASKQHFFHKKVNLFASSWEFLLTASVPGSMCLLIHQGGGSSARRSSPLLAAPRSGLLLLTRGADALKLHADMHLGCTSAGCQIWSTRNFSASLLCASFSCCATCRVCIMWARLYCTSVCPTHPTLSSVSTVCPRAPHSNCSLIKSITSSQSEHYRLWSLCAGGCEIQPGTALILIILRILRSLS